MAGDIKNSTILATTQDPSRCPQDTPGPPRYPKISPKSPKITPRSTLKLLAKIHQNRPKIPKNPQDSSKIHLKTSYRQASPQDPPKPPKIPPKIPQDPPKVLKGLPKIPQAPKILPRSPKTPSRSPKIPSRSPLKASYRQASPQIAT